MKQGYRNLIRIGGSTGLTLSKHFLKERGWQAGDRVAIVYDNVAVIVGPVLSNTEILKETDNGRVQGRDTTVRRLRTGFHI